MHGRSTPHEVSIDALNTATPNLADLADIAQCTYMHGRSTPHEVSIDALNSTTPNLADLADIAQCTYTHGRLTPPLLQLSIDLWKTITPNMFHRSLEKPLHQTHFIYSTLYIYLWQIDPPFPSQLSIDALTTATPNLADLADISQYTYMHGKWNPQSIEHRCLEFHYIKLGRSSRYSTMHIIAWQIYSPVN